MRIIAAFSFSLSALRGATEADPARADATIKAAFPTAPADWQPRLTATRRCSSARPTEQPAEGGRRGDPAARDRRQSSIRPTTISGRLEEGRGAGAVRLRPALHRLSAAPRERRQLLRLPPADEAGGQLRHARPEPARNTASCATSSEAEAKAAYEKIYNSHATFPCSTMPRFGANKVLTIEQIKDAVALLMSPDSPVNK